MPDIVNSNHTGNYYNLANIPVGELGMKKHRHVTVV